MKNELDVLLKGRRLDRIIDKIFSLARKDTGLKQIELEILIYLYEKPDATASEIISDMGFNKGHVSQAFKHLCDEGYLVPRIDNIDRRFVFYDATEKSKPVMEHAASLRDKFRNLLTENISEADLKEFIRCTKLISNNVDRLLKDFPEEDA